MRRHHGRAPSPYAGRTPTPLSAEVILVRNFDHQVNPSRPARQSPLATSQFQGMPLDLIDRIRSFPLFKTAPDTFLYEIGLLLKPQMHSPNDYIMTEGDDAKAMYWIVRGAVAVTSRDGESTYAELRQGSFVGEIGILMERPRTATVIARTRCLTLQLKKEDLKRILPSYPEVERTIREEALERLAILEKKKRQVQGAPTSERRGSKRSREDGEEMEVDANDANNKRRKSPSPGMQDATPASALGYGLVNVRTLLKELPLFADLPAEPLHFLGLNAQPRNFAPFTDIIKQKTAGREVYFIVHGEVEVVVDNENSTDNSTMSASLPMVKARLRSGQYFGEVASLSLAPRRTATVRTVSQVECLMIPEKVLDEFWHRCPPDLRRQIEETAKERLQLTSENDVIMRDPEQPPNLTELELEDGNAAGKSAIRMPRVTFNDAEMSAPIPPLQSEDSSTAEPLDPDPFSSASLDSVRMRSRRGSLAPPPPDEPMSKPTKPRRSPRGSPKSSPRGSPSPSSPSARSSVLGTPSPLASPISEEPSSSFTFSDPFTKIKLPEQTASRAPSKNNFGTIPDQVLTLVFRYLHLHELMYLQRVSLRWRQLLRTNDTVLPALDLAKYNRVLTDEILIKTICPFVGDRPRSVDLSNCFHLTDEGFSALAENCSSQVLDWRMKSVWDVTANAILEMSNKAKGLTAVDLSNCRKVSDTLLARIIGWVVPPQASNYPGMGRMSSMRNRPTLRTKYSQNNVPKAKEEPGMPAAGTVIGCPALSSLTLSYCKHVTDRTMHHLANHASSRLKYLDLTRCTTITDTGFAYWSQSSASKFTSLQTLILADCTYLSDQAIIHLVSAAGMALKKLDLSFCCALSDTSTEVISLGCPKLESLDMSFCGSAVSDASLRSIGNHLNNLRHLAVRGCVRVTGMGVDAVVDGCKLLNSFDVSQCRNLGPWIDSGGERRWRHRGRRVHFEMVK